MERGAGSRCGERSAAGAGAQDAEEHGRIGRLRAGQGRAEVQDAPALITISRTIHGSRSKGPSRATPRAPPRATISTTKKKTVAASMSVHGPLRRRHPFGSTWSSATMSVRMLKSRMKSIQSLKAQKFAKAVHQLRHFVRAFWKWRNL